MFRFQSRRYEFWLLVLVSAFITFQAAGGAEQTRESPLASKYPPLNEPVSAARSNFPLSYALQGENPLFSSAKLEESANQKLALALIKTAEKAGSFAKTVGSGIGDYVREKQIERKREELIQRFYMTLYPLMQPLSLSPDEYRELVTRIENLYIEDGESDALKLDSMTFREMPLLVRREYGEMALARTRNGTVDTYHLNGSIKTRWQIADGKPHGSVITYYEDGEILYIDTYDSGRRTSRKKYDQEGRLEFEQVYDYKAPEIAPSAAALPVETPAG